MNASNYQLRGHCQCCGRQQAVVGGTMSKHGYTVAHGWFEGVCQGQHVQPLEVSRAFTDAAIEQIRTKDVPALLAAAEAYKAGSKTPATIRTSRMEWKDGKRVPVLLAWEEATVHQRKDELTRLEWNARHRAANGLRFADELEQTAAVVHGRELVKVERIQGPAPVVVGEVRQGARYPLTCVSVEGQRVWWKAVKENGQVLKSWTGLAAWRKMTKV